MAGDLMPTDFEITVAAKGGTDRLLAPEQGERVQEMRGFEDTYVDIVDYIVRVTHRIWEEKDIGYIYDTYRHNSRVTDDSGLQYGRDKIVADTVHTINAFPDIRLYADEVIWAGDDSTGFRTSHRTVIVGHNTGHSRWAPPTRRKVVVWAIANCCAIENEIYEEWVLYNNSSLLAQLGFDLRVLARRLGNARARSPSRTDGSARSSGWPGRASRSGSRPRTATASTPSRSCATCSTRSGIGATSARSITATPPTCVTWARPTVSCTAAES